MEFKPELLAPAGKLSVLKAAVNMGADAVYFGLPSFNARNGAVNFTMDDAVKGMEYLKKNGKKGYITLNTLLKDKELPQFLKSLETVCEIGADGVIVQDAGALSLIKEVAPGLHIHGSTQMAVHNLSGVNYLYDNGVERVVLARELSFDEIKYIKENTKCEIEVFIHGALCACYSGRCYMSSFIGGRSGNRGRCAQPCRLNYEMEGVKGTLLSLKDLSSVDYIDKLRDIKIDSLKIEGRLKNEYYVAVVVGAYRKLIDKIPLTKEEQDLLFNIFNRGGFTDYFIDSENKKMFCYNKGENPYSEYEKKAELKYGDIIKENKKDDSSKIPVDVEILFIKDKVPEYKIKVDNKIFEGKGKNAVSKAITSPLKKEKIESALCKLNDTPFYLKNLDIKGDEDIFMPVSSLNELRRDMVKLIIPKKVKVSDKKILTLKRKEKETGYIVRVTKKEQLIWATNNSKTEYVIADFRLVKENIDIIDKNKTVIDLPYIIPSFKEEEIKKDLSYLKEKGIIYGVANNFSDFLILKDFKIITDIYFNLTNSYSCDFLEKENVVLVGASPELNFKELKYFMANKKIFAMGYGYLRMMTLKNCIKKSVLKKCVKGPIKLKDRKGEEFIVDCDYNCNNKIINPHKLIMSDKINDFKNAGVDYILLSFYHENEKECERVINSYINNKEPEGKFTRGHFYRGVL